MLPDVLMARKSTFEPEGTWKLPAHPYDCLVRERHSSEQSVRKATSWMGWFPDTLTCTHHSLPLAPLKVASNAGQLPKASQGSVTTVVVEVLLQLTLVAVAPDGGIQR